MLSTAPASHLWPSNERQRKSLSEEKAVRCRPGEERLGIFRFLDRISKTSTVSALVSKAVKLVTDKIFKAGLDITVHLVPFLLFQCLRRQVL